MAEPIEDFPLGDPNKHSERAVRKASLVSLLKNNDVLSSEISIPHTTSGVTLHNTDGIEPNVFVGRSGPTLEVNLASAYGDSLKGELLTVVLQTTLPGIDDKKEVFEEIFAFPFYPNNSDNTAMNVRFPLSENLSETKVLLPRRKVPPELFVEKSWDSVVRASRRNMIGTPGLRDGWREFSKKYADSKLAKPLLSTVKDIMSA